MLPESNRMRAIEPDYTTVIPPLQLRRMSRVLKMAVYAGNDCLRKAGISIPDGIIAGTSRGNLTDTELFLKLIDQYQEQSLTPTPFILSTYNAVCGSLALQTGATGYNQTFVHRGHSLEHALFNAQMELNNAEGEQHYLVGGFDEITDEYFWVKDHLHYWKKTFKREAPLLNQTHTEGSLAGEGAGFFMLTNKKLPGCQALEAIATFDHADPQRVSDDVDDFLSSNQLGPEDIDMLVLGLNGDKNDQVFYEQCLAGFSVQIPVMAYKHLCGEFETSGIFALYLLQQMAKDISLPDVIWFRAPKTLQKPKRVLFYNVFRALEHNYILSAL